MTSNETKKTHNIVDNAMSKTYPTNIGAPAFTVPEVLSRKKHRGADATHQLKTRFDQLKQEYFNLCDLAEDTEMVYNARCNFNPVVGKTYHLYEGEMGMFLSLLAPHEWDMEHRGSFKLTAEHTWERQ